MQTAPALFIVRSAPRNTHPGRRAGPRMTIGGFLRTVLPVSLFVIRHPSLVIKRRSARPKAGRALLVVPPMFVAASRRRPHAASRHEPTRVPPVTGASRHRLPPRSREGGRGFGVRLGGHRRGGCGPHRSNTALCRRARVPDILVRAEYRAGHACPTFSLQCSIGRGGMHRSKGQAGHFAPPALHRPIGCLSPCAC